MPTITLPQAGKGMEAGTVRRWRKKPGEAVVKGDILLEIEFEQGLVEIEAGVAGQLQQVLVGEGRTVAVGSPLAVIGEGSAAEVKPAMAETKSNPASGGKVVAVLMPKAGQSMEEGLLVKWHVQVGQEIKAGQVIFEIETDKATMDVEATDSGKLARIVLGEGQVCKVLEPVAYLAESPADVEAFLASQGTPGAPAAPPQPPASAPLPTPSQAVQQVLAAIGSGERVKASPAARKIAEERGVDLGLIGVGSGPGGRILSTDLPPAAPAVAGPAAAATAAASVTTAEGVVRKKMSPMRKAIAKNLTLSKQTVPHFYVKLSINAEPLHAFYQGEKAKYPCSLNDVVIMACAQGIKEFAGFRSRIEGEEIVEFPSANIGIAVGLEEGLVVPVLVGAEKLSLKEIGVASKRLAVSAKNGKIEGMGKGVFTISNMGMFGVEEFSAIINPPESAILAVGAMREEVIVSGGTLKAGRVMTLSLSVDHRVVDGMMAAKFMGRLKELLEWPAQMVE